MNDSINQASSNKEKTRILILEDMPNDAELVIRELKTLHVDHEARIVDSKDSFIKQLEDFKPHIVLSDYSMPSFDGKQAIKLLKEYDPLIPLIIITGSLNEETAVKCMKMGAVDYLIKENITRLCSAVIGALESKQLKKEKIAGDLALQEAALIWKTTFDSISDAVSIMNINQETTHCNQAMQDMLGKTESEILGKCCSYWWAHGNNSCSNDNCPFQKAKLSKHKESDVFKIGDKMYEGTVYPILEKDNSISGAVHIISDITKQKRDEDELVMFQYLVDQSDDSFYVIDPITGDILDTNITAYKELGYSRDEISKLSVIDVETSIPDISSWQTLVLKFRQSISVLIPGIHKRKDGTTFPVEVNIKIIKYNDKEYVIGLARNITERINAEEIKEKLEYRLNQAQKMEAIGTLAGGIAHDFNNVLGIILGYTQLSKEKVPKESSIENWLNQILIAANRAKDLVAQILTFSRQAQVQRIHLDIDPIVKEGLKLLRSTIPSTIEIISDIDLDNKPILADPTQTHQIVMNLCTNSYHAMEKTGGKLSVALKNTVIKPNIKNNIQPLIPGEYIELTVSDTGSGIRSDIIGKIFDPYFTTKEVGKGTGMGLAIIHSIISDYGGAITVESKLGKGTTFHVFFPVVEKDAPNENIELENIPRGTERVLYIDDEKPLAEMGKKMLEMLGYHVTTVSSSVEALAIFKNSPHEFDIVITDQTMPNMTGSELSHRMMQIRPDIPIILCTGYSNNIDSSLSKKMGIKEFVLKPITLDVLSKLIRKVLDNG